MLVNTWHTWSIVMEMGCLVPSFLDTPGSVTSMVSACRRAFFCISFSAFIRSDSRPSISALVALAIMPICFLSSGLREPMERRISVIFPFFPKSFTRSSSASVKETAFFSCSFASSNMVFNWFCICLFLRVLSCIVLSK